MVQGRKVLMWHTAIVQRDVCGYKILRFWANLKKYQTLVPAKYSHLKVYDKCCIMVEWWYHGNITRSLPFTLLLMLHTHTNMQQWTRDIQKLIISSFFYCKSIIITQINLPVPQEPIDQQYYSSCHLRFHLARGTVFSSIEWSYLGGGG